MKVLHLMASGKSGGIEALMTDYAKGSKHTNIFLFVWERGHYAEQIEKYGCKTYFINGHAIGNIRSLKKIVILVRQESPDVIVAHHGSPLIRFSLILLHILQPDIHSIMYCHCDAKKEISANCRVKARIRKVINYLAVRSVTGVVVISQFVRNSVIECFHADTDKIHIIYNGIDLRRFDVPIRVGSKKTELIFVGRLVNEKGVQIVLQAIAALPEKKELHFSIVGDGPYKDELEMLAQKLQIENVCDFLGRREDIPQLLQKADVFVHACICEEGLGISIIEAMAAGKICICSDSGAIPELIVSEENGFLVPKGDAESLSCCLKTVMHKKEKWVEIQNNAKNRAKEFNIECFTQALDRLLEKVDK